MDIGYTEYRIHKIQDTRYIILITSIKTPSRPIAVICRDFGRNIVINVIMQVARRPNPKPKT